MPAATSTIDVHLLGLGPVGRAFLRQLDPERYRVRAISDSSATMAGEQGLDAQAWARRKEAGLRLSRFAGSASIASSLALDLVDADVVVDATATGRDGASASEARCRVALRRERALVLAAKDGLAAGASTWARAGDARLGFNAVLGGTGLSLRRERETLAGARSVTVVANASTTAVLQAVERGDTIEAGIGAAQRAGLLEADPTLDLDGTDAAVKLACVAGLLWGQALCATDVEREDLRALDPELVRARRARGWTTRLVARLARDGRATATYEPVAIGSALDVPADRVVYTYDLGEGRTRVHVGRGLGPERTARALLADLDALVAEGSLR